MIRFVRGRQISWGLIVAALLAGPGWVRADGTSPDCYVLSVGIDGYLKEKRLSGCINDARDVAARFAAQQGKRFGTVTPRVLTERDAGRASIARGLTWLGGAGREGDFAVLFLSGHGARKSDGSWSFLPQDYDSRRHAATALGDREILQRAGALAERGLTVLVIIDACFSGQLRLSAGSVFDRPYRSGAGVVIMVSSMASQTSAALGPYSAFARTVVEAMAGEADANGDGRVTLLELRHYTSTRTHQLLRQKGIKDKQDAEFGWSRSIRGDLELAVVGPRVASRPGGGGTGRPVPDGTGKPGTGQLAGTVWSGSERLAGYGKLTFRLKANNRATMYDARDTMEGTWHQQGSQVTLRFDDGRVVYRGTLNGETLSGSASNGERRWTWSVRAMGSPRASR
jgi:Caspase domain